MRVSLPLVAEWHGAGRPSVEPLKGAAPRRGFLCPSYPEDDGTRFGVRNEHGHLVFVQPDSAAPDHQSAEGRFSGPCATQRCLHWSGYCNLGAVLSRGSTQLGIDLADTPQTVGECPILGQCRWFAENGRDACVACTVVTYWMEL